MMEFARLSITAGDAFSMGSAGMEHKNILEGFIVAHSNPNLKRSILLEEEKNILPSCFRCV